MIEEIIKNKEYFYDSSTKMKLTSVTVKVGKCVSYTMRNHFSNEFILNACHRIGDTSTIIITTLQKVEDRRFDEIVKASTKYNCSFLGYLKKKNMLGLEYSIVNQLEEELANITYTMSFSRKPIYFELKLIAPTFDDIEDKNGAYIEASSSIVLKTKNPVYNTELNSFLHNFGT